MSIDRPSLTDRIDQLLPQTQCTQCDYPRCREYAEAISAGEAEINQCPPGADITIAALSELTNKPVLPLNPANGIAEPRLLAFIRESACIGCKLCIKACPVDAIIGAGKVMHTVIVDECTGCKLCLPVCPTDCIDLIAAPPIRSNREPSIWPEFSQSQVEKSRHRTEKNLEREAIRDTAKKARKIDKQRLQLKQEIAAVLARKRGSR